MPQIHPLYIILSALGLFLSVAYVFLFIKEKRKGLYLLSSALTWLLLPILMVTGMFLHSTKLISAAILFPTALAIVGIAINNLGKYKKCTHIVSAKCVSFIQRGTRPYYSPQFSYDYKGENILAYSTSLYRKRRLNKLFKINNTYDIFIDPNNPKNCIANRNFSISNVLTLLAGSLVFAFGIMIILFN